MAEVLVELDNVVKRFGEFEAVKTLNLDIYKGEFLALMGSSGCGKTTTLRMIAGLEQPSEGVVRQSGRVMNDVGVHERDTPMVWQSLALFPFLNAIENVEFGLKMRGVAASERRKRAMDWLDRMGIAEFAERDVAQLSGGQRQRVALARSLVIEPEILLLDEPLSALDAHLVIRMQGVLTQLQRELGITFVYVTHSQSEAFAMADRVVIMTEGEVAQVGSPREIYRAPSNTFVAEFVGRNNILSGEVMLASDATLQVRTPVGEFEVPNVDERDVGQALTFVVAADRVRLGHEKPELGNALECRLISEEFIGSVVTLFLESQDGTELKAQIQQRELDNIDPEPGAILWLGWAPEHSHVLPAKVV